MYELLKHCPSILSQSSHNFSISLASSHSLDAIVGLRHPLDRDISGANWKAGYGTGRTAAEDMLRKGIRSDNESLSPAAVFTGIHRHLGTSNPQWKRWVDPHKPARAFVRRLRVVCAERGVMEQVLQIATRYGCKLNTSSVWTLHAHATSIQPHRYALSLDGAHAALAEILHPQDFMLWRAFCAGLGPLEQEKLLDKMFGKGHSSKGSHVDGGVKKLRDVRRDAAVSGGR